MIACESRTRRPFEFETSDNLNNGTATTQADGGDVDEVTADVTWSKPTKPLGKPHSIWQHLLDHGTPAQVARLKDDPGLQPDAPTLSVLTAADGLRAFSIGVEQLRPHRAMWLPEHDVFVSLAPAPADFAEYRAAFKGERVLDRVKRESKARPAEWMDKWADFGNPTRTHHGQETSCLGAKGHLTGTVAQHGSLCEFGMHRWANVRPDFASPHKFRLDLLWPEFRWIGQRIVDGLPIIVTTPERGGQRCEIARFAAPLRDAPSVRRGEVASVFFTSLAKHRRRVV
jgi:hypothetical protein